MSKKVSNPVPEVKRPPPPPPPFSLPIGLIPRLIFTEKTMVKTMEKLMLKMRETNAEFIVACKVADHLVDVSKKASEEDYEARINRDRLRDRLELLGDKLVEFVKNTK